MIGLRRIFAVDQKRNEIVAKNGEPLYRTKQLAVIAKQEVEKLA